MQSKPCAMRTSIIHEPHMYMRADTIHEPHMYIIHADYDTSYTKWIWRIQKSLTTDARIFDAYI